MLLGNERNYDLGMDALATVCSWETNGIMIWNGCSGHRMLLGNERNYDLDMDALATVCSWETHKGHTENTTKLEAMKSWSPPA